MDKRYSLKRSRYMILSQILDICTNGASKTRIVYKGNLNFSTVNLYLDSLIKNDLIEEKNNEQSHKIYKTTEKGMNLLENMKQINIELGTMAEEPA